jgi:hypothetical protein
MKTKKLHTTLTTKPSPEFNCQMMIENIIRNLQSAFSRFEVCHLMFNSDDDGLVTSVDLEAGIYENEKKDIAILLEQSLGDMGKIKKFSMG